jgi:murein L,D-transpeptidase YafK
VTRSSRFRRSLRAAQAVGLVVVACTASAVADGGLPHVARPVFTNDTEGSLVRAITSLRESGLQHALDEIDNVLARKPNFRLAYLMQGDLLMARAGRPVAFASNAASASTVAPLQDEARVRLKRYLDAPPVDYLPAPLLQLGEKESYVLLVDTSRSRLFVYANDLGRPRYVTDFYISLGKNGVEKSREGDMKTPIGVYTVISEKDKLPDLYGTRAYPLSYPNDWDRMHGRSGHGIWLHGTPSNTYSRAPWATDGCVVLTNEDFARLSKYIDVSRTPVVIGEAVQWIDPRKWEAEREGFLKALDGWKADWESRDVERYLSHYSEQFHSERLDSAAWKARKRKVGSNKTWIKVRLDDVSFYQYPGSPGTMMVTFAQDYRSNNLSHRTFKRQFWVREGQTWRIVHESVLS